MGSSLKDANITVWPTLGYNFWGITKCANTAVKTHLYELATKQRFTDKKHTRIHGVDSIIYASRQEAMENGLRNFSVTRNPYDRFLSIYSDMILSRPKRGVVAGLDPAMSVDDVLDFIQAATEPDVHLRTQSSFIPVHEFLTFDVTQLATWPLALDPVKQKRHQSKIKHIGLNALQRERVYQLYKEDFVNFNYLK